MRTTINMSHWFYLIRYRMSKFGHILRKESTYIKNQSYQDTYVNNKIWSPILIFFNKKTIQKNFWHRKMTLKVRIVIPPYPSNFALSLSILIAISLCKREKPRLFPTFYVIFKIRSNGFALCTVFLLNFEEIFVISSLFITATWLNW